MAESKLGGQLGNRLALDMTPTPVASFSRRGNSRLAAAFKTEAEEMGGDPQSQLQEAIDKLKKEATGESGDTLSEAPWKGPLDPEGEIN